MKCPQCKNEMAHNQGKYHYKGSGLDYIYLADVEVFECSCGEKLMSIPRVKALHALIGLKLINKKSLLSGNEIRFLRKNMRLRAKDFAQKIRVKQETVSRWEKGSQKPNLHVDFVIRTLYASQKGFDTRELTEQVWPHVTKDARNAPEKIVLKESEWTGAAMALGKEGSQTHEIDLQALASKMAPMIAAKLEPEFNKQSEKADQKLNKQAKKMDQHQKKMEALFLSSWSQRHSDEYLQKVHLEVYPIKEEKIELTVM